VHRCQWAQTEYLRDISTGRNPRASSNLVAPAAARNCLRKPAAPGPMTRIESAGGLARRRPQVCKWRAWRGGSRRGAASASSMGTKMGAGTLAAAGGACGRQRVTKYSRGHTQLPSPHSSHQSNSLTIQDHVFDLPNARKQSKIRDGMCWQQFNVRPTRQLRLCFWCDNCCKYGSPHTATATQSAQ